jgi:hypothetical protein
MMSSVIPARLQFQCGHTALVSLPRVKGESSVQRTDRIAREKRAAHTRACDFCPPAVAVLEVAQTVVLVAAQPEIVPEPEPAPVVLVLAEPEPESPVEVPALVVAAPRNDPAPTPRRVGRPRRTAAPAQKGRTNSGRVSTYRYLVRFRTETVLEAIDIRDALRQAESLGATEVLALTRRA